MKIAVLSSHTPSLFWFRMDMMLNFIKLGHEVIAIGNEEESIWSSQFKDKKITYRQAFIQRNGMNPLCDFKTFFSIKKILKEENPDKIFTYQAKTVIYGSIAANILGIKEVYPLIAGIGSVFLSNSMKSKVIGSILKAEYKIAMKKCSKVFFQNQDDVSIFIEKKIVDIDRVVMLNGSGVNLEKFTVQPLPIEFGFLCISRLISDKGVREYLNACRILKTKYPSVRCMLVGPFDSNPTALTENELNSYINDGVIEYYGEQSDVRPYLAQCSVFVLPSYHEGTPKTVLEAMASFKAIITTDAPGCKETVVDGVNGYLVPVRDVKSLVDRMEKLLNNPDVIIRMASLGREIVEEKFDVIKINQTINTCMGL